MDRVADIDKAIGAHTRWMSQLRETVLEAHPGIELETIRAADQCEFGKWLEGTSWSAEDRISDDYQEVRRLHAEFHELAAQVVELAASGKKNEAYGMFYCEYVTLSGRLALTLRTWQDRLSRAAR
ncbi:CZB domain-containing protein [Accumulibacter sp.]|uniref:CZB domain-containing protein n=1 Tax=Accumulibacter sp. TaxID=2053492 RepID=UPI001A4AD0D5|nr:CZB domain-containing protein [Accumulibacter sp.]MBL8401654.1 CZB domain-containing protein [Accumulibacter sp.]